MIYFPYHHSSSKSTPFSLCILKLWRKVQSSAELDLFKWILTPGWTRFYWLCQNELASPSAACAPYPPDPRGCKSCPHSSAHPVGASEEEEAICCFNVTFVDTQIIKYFLYIELSGGPGHLHCLGYGIRFLYNTAQREGWFVKSLWLFPSFCFLMNHNCAKGNEDEVRRVSGKFISLGPVTRSKLSKVTTPWL